MNSIVKDFLARVTPTPPATFWKYLDKEKGAPAALVAEMEVARTGLGGYNYNTKQQQQQQQTSAAPPSAVAKFTGSHVFVQLQGALRHGGRPALAAFEALKGRSTCLDVAAAGLNHSNSKKQKQKRTASSGSTGNNRPATLHRNSLEELAAGAHATTAASTSAQPAAATDSPPKTKKDDECERCTCDVNEPGLCRACHESLRVTAWRLYALTTLLFEFREVASTLIVSDPKTAPATSTATSSSANRATSSTSPSSPSAASDNNNNNSNSIIALPTLLTVTECCAVARDLAGKVFLLSRKLHTRWAHHRMQRRSEKKMQQEHKRETRRKAREQNRRKKNSVEQPLPKEGDGDTSPPQQEPLLDGTQTVPVATLDEQKSNLIKADGNNNSNSHAASDDEEDLFHDDDNDGEEQEDPDVDHNDVYRVEKFYIATFLQHAMQVSLDVLAMLVTGFESEGSIRFAQPHMDRLSAPHRIPVTWTEDEAAVCVTSSVSASSAAFRETAATTAAISAVIFDKPQQQMTKSEQYQHTQALLKAHRRSVFEAMSKLRDTAVASLAQSLLLTREALMAAFIFSRGCHDVIIAYEETLARQAMLELGNFQASRAAAGLGSSSSSDDDENDEFVDDAYRRASNYFPASFRKGKSSAQSGGGGIGGDLALLIERNEKTLVNIELSALKLARSVLTPPTVFDARHIDERGEHPSSFVAGELCDATLETSHIFTGVQRHQIAAGIAQRVVSLLDPNGGLAINGGSARHRSRDEDTDSTATTMHSRPFAPSRLAIMYAVNAAQLLLHLAVHDLWVAFARLPSQVKKLQRAAARSAMAAVGSPRASLSFHQQDPGASPGTPGPQFPSSSSFAATPPHLQHGSVEMHPAREGRVQTFLGNLAASELEPLSDWFVQLLLLPSAVVQTTIPADNHNNEQQQPQQQHHQQHHHHHSQALLTGAEKKSILAALLGVHWCLYGNPNDRAHEQQEQREFLLLAVGLAGSGGAQKQSTTRISTPVAEAAACKKLLTTATPAAAWAAGLFNVSTVSLSAGLGFFHSLGLSAHCASVCRSDTESLNTNLTLCQHRGVLHLPVGDDIFVDSGFMPLVKGQATTISLEAPPSHPIDPKEYAPGLCSADQRSTVSAVLTETLLAAPRALLIPTSSFSSSSSAVVAFEKQQQQHKLPDPAAVTGMASLLTTTLVAVAAPKKTVARIPFSSIRIGSLHKYTASAVLSTRLSTALESAAAEQLAAAQEEADNSSYDTAPAAYDPQAVGAAAGSNREMLLDLNRSLVLLNGARQASSVQLGIRADFAGVALRSAFSDAVAERPFLGAGFIFSAASEGVKKTSLKPDWYRMSQFTLEHQATTKALLLAPPTVEERERLLQQQQAAGSKLQAIKQLAATVGSAAAPALQLAAEKPLTLAEQRKQRWTQEAAIQARRQALSSSPKRRALPKHEDDNAAQLLGISTPKQQQQQQQQPQDSGTVGESSTLNGILEADERARAAEAIIASGEAPDYVPPENALHEAQAVAATKTEQMQRQCEAAQKERDEAMQMVTSLRNQADIVATCVIPPLQSEVKLLRHLLGQTLGALRAAERVAEKQNEKMAEFERKLQQVAGVSGSASSMSGL